jgi:taurine dioxygenase
MEIRRIAGALGAELLGVDLSRQLGAQAVAEIRKAFLEHQVIFFRDQTLTPAQFMAFARSMGRPIQYPFVKGIEGFPEIIEVKKLEHERHNFGGIWHSDTAYLEEPPMGSMLLAREVPPYGGHAVNSSAKADVSRTREDRVKEQGGTAGSFEAGHPVVRTHPETGRKALYVNVAHTARFEGMTEEESAPLLAFLFRHQVSPEFTCRFQWRVGSLAFWDNRCTQHNPVNDYHGHRRLMYRITLAGDRPR